MADKDTSWVGETARPAKMDVISQFHGAILPTVNFPVDSLFLTEADGSIYWQVGTFAIPVWQLIIKTTPFAVTLASMYQAFYGLTTIGKQRFVYWFDGKDLSVIWTKTNIAGTGTFAMVDTIDEGYMVRTGAVASDSSEIDMNNKRQINNANSALISVTKRVDTNCELVCGLSNFITGSNLEAAFYRNLSTASFIDLLTGDATVSSGSNSDVAPHTNYTVAKVTTGASDILLHLDGVLKVTKTTNRPTVKLQPKFRMLSNTSAATKEGRIRFLEAYNL